MKSIEVKLNETIASLTKANLIGKFDEKFTDHTKVPIEVQLNAGLALLKEAGIIESITESGWGLTFAPKSTVLGVEDIDEAKRDYAILFGVEPRPQATTKEAVVRHIPKKNGDGRTITESVSKVDGRKEKLVESMRGQFNGNENAARQFLGLAPKAPEGLNRYQAVEYNFARKCGLSESDALVLAKLPLKR